MITLEEVRNKMMIAEMSLNQCFDMLIDIKYAKDNASNAIVEFQPKLARCLLELMQFYKKLQSDKKELVSNKGNYNPDEFVEMMRVNKKYLDVISETIKIGKSFGDAYAWLFYRDNRDELDKHFQHEATGLFVAGIGGAGEVNFAETVKQINGMFVINHSITDMLRIGDFSLYDCNLGIAGTGEIKTFRAGDKLNITANIVSKVGITNNYSEEIEIVSEQSKIEEINKAFPKLDKQLQVQETLLKIKPCDQQMNLETDYEYDLINRLTSENTMVTNTDNSLLLCGFWNYKNSLFEVLYEDYDPVQNMDKKLEENITKIIRPDSQFNQVIVGQISTAMNCFRIPVFWWKINDVVCRNLYFRRMAVMSVFNPANLVNYFTTQGFEVKHLEGNKKATLEKKLGDMVIELGHVESIYELISQSLMRTEAVFALYQNVLDTIDNGEVAPDTSIELNIHLRNFGNKG